ncbi:MAG TPA: hypothetical protein VGS22_27665 [Thermoanaerobaculia bacterium]|jgi:hypothetical protein|nr:hypothetical protein [Thermoanaerobaculia bacterium]
MATKKTAKRTVDDLRPEYDLATLGKGVRGKYYEQAMAGSNIAVLDPDVAKAFPSSEAVNKALRLLVDVAAETARPTRKRRTQAA